MDFEVFSYWNTTELIVLFNAVASLTNSSDFLGLLKFLAIVALISITITVLAGRTHLEDMWRWVIMLSLFHGLLLLPKATIAVVDRTTANPNPQLVANVPLGVAMLAGGVSKIGDWLTTSFEGVFSLPDDVQFRKSGTLFGARVIRDILMARSGSPVLSSNMMDFIRECVYPEFATGKVPPHEIVRQPDIWAYLDKKTNIARYVEIREIPSGIMMLPMTCPDAYTALTTQISTVVAVTIGDMANALNPTVPAAMRQTMTQGQIVTSANLYTSIASTAPEIIRQGMVMNQFLDAQYKIPAQIGDAATATTALAEVQALRSTSESYKVMAAVGQQVMPKMRNIIEMIQYALAPLALLMVIVLGHYGLRALAMYAKSLLWIQLWPPLYAVMNFIVTMYSVKQADAVAHGGMSMITYTYLNNLMVSDQAIAGMIAAVGVPTIAWMMVEGLSLGAAAFSNVLRSPMGAEAARFASAASQGNVSMGQLGVDNQTMWQYNTQPNTHVGAPIHYSTGSNGIITTTLPDGREVFNSSLLRHNTSMRMTFGKRMASTYQEQSESAHTAAASDMATSARLYASGLQQSFDFARSHGGSERSGTHTGTGSQIGFSKAANEAMEVTNNFARDHGLSQSQGAEILGIASATIRNPKAIDMLSPLSVEATSKTIGRSSAESEQTLKSAIGYLQRDGHAEVLNRAVQAAQNTNFDTADESARRAAEGISSSFNESQTHADMAAAHYQQSQSYKEMAGQLKESSGAFEASMYHQFMNWMKTQYHSYGDRNFDGPTVSEMAEYNPELLIPFLDEFYKGHIESLVIQNAPQFKSPEDIRQFFHEQKQMVGGAGSVRAFHGSSVDTVSGVAGSAGVQPDNEVTSNLPGKYQKVEGRVNEAIDIRERGVTAQGEPLQKEAEYKTNPGTQNLGGKATSNALGQILPDGISSVIGDPEASVTEAQRERVQQGEPNNPTMDAIRKIIPKVPKE